MNSNWGPRSRVPVPAGEAVARSKEGLLECYGEGATRSSDRQGRSSPANGRRQLESRARARG